LYFQFFINHGRLSFLILIVTDQDHLFCFSKSYFFFFAYDSFVFENFLFFSKKIAMEKLTDLTKTKAALKTVVVNETVTDEKFKPKGAIAFFVLLIFICAAIWYSIYYIQLTRQ